MAFGTAGAYVLIFAGIVISLILVTQKSVFRLLQKGSKKVYTNAKAEHNKRVQKRAQTVPARNNQKTGRRSRSASGITQMTTLKKEEKEPEEAL